MKGPDRPEGVSLRGLPKIERLHLADVTLPPSHPLGGGACPVYAYLVLHPDGPVLVDTGVGDHPDIEVLYRPVRRPVTEALAAVGTRRSQVVAVVNTHLHFDHCGENRLFPGVPIFVQRAEYEAAHEPGYTVAEWADFPGANYELLDGEAQVLAGVSVIPTPGHTPGHQSVLIESDESCVVIAGQAAYTAREFERTEDVDVRGQWSEEQYCASLRRLRGLRPRAVYLSHDATTWTRPESGAANTGRGSLSHG
ncbi:MAG: N-acyl homoserine lactonase family protein [Dehalococcoidia bacterium]|nr:N-acyl homoserine lactonase family protein [Dehalococcoidia bacterium]